jgi:periplasmic mercuric ion binding protein
MKQFIISTLALIAAFTANAQDKTETFKVYGNCGMCERRIEKAAKVEGVSKADWDEETKMLTVVYDPAKTSNAKIQKAVAAVGHDTEKETAKEDVYKKLPGCCKYDRKQANDHSSHNHSHK